MVGIEIKMEHVFIFVIVLFILYYFMKNSYRYNIRTFMVGYENKRGTAWINRKLSGWTSKHEELSKKLEKKFPIRIIAAPKITNGMISENGWEPLSWPGSNDYNPIKNSIYEGGIRKDQAFLAVADKEIRLSRISIMYENLFNGTWWRPLPKDITDEDQLTEKKLNDKIKKDLVLCDNWYDNDSEFICGVKNLLPNKPFLIGYGESVRCDDDIVLKKSNILQIWLPYSPNADQIELENNWGRRCNNPYPGPSNY